MNPAPSAALTAAACGVIHWNNFQSSQLIKFTLLYSNDEIYYVVIIIVQIQAIEASECVAQCYSGIEIA